MTRFCVAQMRNDHAEPNAEAFIFGFDFPADGVIEKVDWKKIKPTAACPPAGWRWLHFNRLAAETREWLEESSDLDETVITAIEDLSHEIPTNPDPIKPRPQLPQTGTRSRGYSES